MEWGAQAWAVACWPEASSAQAPLPTDWCGAEIRTPSFRSPWALGDSSQGQALGPGTVDQSPWGHQCGSLLALCSVAAPGNKPELYEVSGRCPPGHSGQ